MATESGAKKKKTSPKNKRRKNPSHLGSTATKRGLNIRAEAADIVPTPIVAIDREFTVTYINPAGAGMSGRTPEQVIGMKCYDLFRTPHCRTADCRCDHAMRTGESSSGETVADPQGINLPIKYTASPLKDADDNIVGALEYVVDITDVKVALEDAQAKVDFLDNIPTPVMTVDREFKVQFLNKAGAAAVGRSSEACIGQKCFSLFNTEDCNTPNCQVAKAMQQNGIFTGDTVAKLPGGELPIRYSAAPLKDEQGNIIGALEYVIDITQELDITNSVANLARAAMEGNLDARAEAEKFTGNYHNILNGVNKTIETLASHINSVPAPIMIIDNDFTIQYMNHVGADVIGMSQKQLIGTKCYDHFKTSDCRTANCACARAMTNGRTEQSETDAHPGGKDLVISYTGAPIKDEQGKIIGALEIVTDQTAIKQAMDDAQMKVDFLNNIPTPVMAVDKEFNVQFMNPAGASALGKTPEACLGQKCSNLFNTSHCNTPNCQLHKAMQQNGIFTDETVAKLPSGELPIRYTGAPLRDEQGNVIGALEYVIDISQEIQAINGVLGLVQSAAAGELETRANVEEYEGNFKKIIKGINDTLDAIVDPISEASIALKKVAERDLSARLVGDYDGDLIEFRDNLNLAVENLDGALMQVSQAVEQVTSASNQIASGSQALAEGSNEQASSLEEVSSSLEEMAAMTKQNADNANQAKTLAGTARGSAEQGNEAMNRMTDAIDKIKGSANQTAKIIKTIDEIAFQTNLLALNAAVEAARAGEAGKGFAVVAEEVRNLAMRSADAAKNTADLIEESVKNSEGGVRITEDVAKTLGEIVDSATKVNDLVAEIAAASSEQAQGIDQVNTAVAQMNKVTQQNAANSEESASAAEELNSQAEELAGMVGTFSLSGNGGNGGALGRLGAGVQRFAPAQFQSQGQQQQGTTQGLGNRVRAMLQEEEPVADAAPARKKAAKPRNARKSGNTGKSKKSRKKKSEKPEEVIPLTDDELKDF
ncbi:MAG: methyl-accepting chemotaxis protein [Planctomycetota bacterium]|jgi:methyl-accepting chemotaxis protein